MTGVAVAGAGNWCKNLVRNDTSLGGVELKYIYDRTEAVCASMGSAVSPGHCCRRLPAASGRR